MGAKISAVIIGSISANVEVDVLKNIAGLEIFQVTDRKSCQEIVEKISGDDIVFIISDGREVYYAEKFFVRVMALKIFLVTEAHAVDNKNLRDAVIQLPAQNFTHSIHEIIDAFQSLAGGDGLVSIDLEDVRRIFKNSGKATAMIGTGNSLGVAVENALAGHDIKSARAAVLSITASSDLASMTEINAASEKVQAAIHNDAKIMFSVATDDEFGDKVKVVIIAAKFSV